ncbi:hypothetical protein AVEN_24157-1 [Araneus ventricosus]|uniref:Uncharacterized protein n=1 Tax=Araneus ventricosus TaxID=182803 RepID=A0A4Y2U277_ARAVE|nr:hypothetical protein AVEN_24157-1 [Araneus ventricosus]
MDQHYYRSASNSLLARTADRTPKTFTLQGDPSRSLHTSSSKSSPYIVSPAGRDVTWNDLSHSWRIFSPNRDIEKIPAPLRSHISSPRWLPIVLSGVVKQRNSYQEVTGAPGNSLKLMIHDCSTPLKWNGGTGVLMQRSSYREAELHETASSPLAEHNTLLERRSGHSCRFR